MAMETGYSLADLAAVTDGKRDEGFMGGGMWIFFLFILLLFSGRGFGGFGGNDNVGGAANFINNDFIYTNLKSTLDQGFTQQANQSFNIQREVLNGFHGVDNAVCTLGYQTGQGIKDIQREIADCCCTTNRNIDAVRYEAERNTCAITQAIHADGDATRALINANTMQELRDRVQDQKFLISQQAQTATLKEAILPKLPVAAYWQPSPYAAYGHNNCGGCGCGNF